jgi:hypothetical protein
MWSRLPGRRIWMHGHIPRYCFLEKTRARSVCALFDTFNVLRERGCSKKTNKDNRLQRVSLPPTFYFRINRLDDCSATSYLNNLPIHV